MPSRFCRTGSGSVGRSKPRKDPGEGRATHVSRCWPMTASAPSKSDWRWRYSACLIWDRTGIGSLYAPSGRVSRSPPTTASRSSQTSGWTHWLVRTRSSCRDRATSWRRLRTHCSKRCGMRTGAARGGLDLRGRLHPCCCRPARWPARHTHWAHTEKLSRRYPRVQVDADVLYVDNGDIMTSAGRAAGLDLCLHIVRSDHGAEIANQVARRLVIAPHREGGQAQYIRQPVPQIESDALATRICLGAAPSRSRPDDLEPCHQSADEPAHLYPPF